MILHGGLQKIHAGKAIDQILWCKQHNHCGAAADDDVVDGDYHYKECECGATTERTAHNFINYDFDVENMYSLQGEVIQGENFEEFYVDDDALQELIVKLFYEPV